MTTSELVKAATSCADALEAFGVPAGAVRAVTRAYVELLARVLDAEDEGPRCAGCGALLPYGGRGRPRKWCPDSRCQSARKNPAKRFSGIPASEE